MDKGDAKMDGERGGGAGGLMQSRHKWTAPLQALVDILICFNFSKNPRIYDSLLIVSWSSNFTNIF